MYDPTDLLQLFTRELLHKRGELDAQVSAGALTIEQAEAELGRWYRENVPGDILPDEVIDIRPPAYPTGSAKALAEDYRLQRMNAQLAREHPAAYQEACILAADALAVAVLDD